MNIDLLSALKDSPPVAPKVAATKGDVDFAALFSELNAPADTKVVAVEMASEGDGEEAETLVLDDVEAEVVDVDAMADTDEVAGDVVDFRSEEPSSEAVRRSTDDAWHQGWPGAFSSQTSVFRDGADLPAMRFDEVTHERSDDRTEATGKLVDGFASPMAIDARSGSKSFGSKTVGQTLADEPIALPMDGKATTTEHPVSFQRLSDENGDSELLAPVPASPRAHDAISTAKRKGPLETPGDARSPRAEVRAEPATQRSSGPNSDIPKNRSEQTGFAPVKTGHEPSQAELKSAQPDRSGSGSVSVALQHGKTSPEATDVAGLPQRSPTKIATDRTAISDHRQPVASDKIETAITKVVATVEQATARADHVALTNASNARKTEPPHVTHGSRLPENEPAAKPETRQPKLGITAETIDELRVSLRQMSRASDSKLMSVSGTDTQISIPALKTDLVKSDQTPAPQDPVEVRAATSEVAAKPKTTPNVAAVRELTSGARTLDQAALTKASGSRAATSSDALSEEGVTAAPVQSSKDVSAVGNTKPAPEVMANHPASVTAPRRATYARNAADFVEEPAVRKEEYATKAATPSEVVGQGSSTFRQPELSKARTPLVSQPLRADEPQVSDKRKGPIDVGEAMIKWPQPAASATPRFQAKVASEGQAVEKKEASVSQTEDAVDVSASTQSAGNDEEPTRLRNKTVFASSETQALSPQMTLPGDQIAVATAEITTGRMTDIAPVDAKLDATADTARTNAANPTLPHRPDLGPRVAEQVMQVARAMPDGPVEITLSPEELGRVRMQVTSVEQSVTLAITADRPETLDLLRRHIDQLVQDYKAMGYSDVSFAFSSGAGHGGDGTDDQTGNGDQNPARPEISVTDDANTAPTVAVDGVDIRL